MRHQLYYLPLQILLSSVCLRSVAGFTASKHDVRVKPSLHLATADSSTPSVATIEGASQLLAEWDKSYNPESQGHDSTKNENDDDNSAQSVPMAVRLLADSAANERNQDSTQGRCMLGICASSAEEGLATLKSWVTALELPRGLLHGMDKDGVPLELDGGVYIKYNSGGVYSFADIRKSGLGFDALWKPGDAMLETYDGIYRGVYFQVELTDGEFRQYMVPLDIFMS
jgi:hypothetical protein